jgi:hypothetical protein
MLSVIYAAQKAHNAECRYAECRGASKAPYVLIISPL